jgi:hypothetical protein
MRAFAAPPAWMTWFDFSRLMVRPIGLALLYWKKAARPFTHCLTSSRLVDELPDEQTKDCHERFEIDELKAHPIDQSRNTSPWMLLPKNAGASIGLLSGKSDYKAHAGAYSGGTNAVYWLRIIKNVGNDVLVQNITAKSKTEVETVERRLEKDLLYTLIRWLDVSRFHAHPAAYLLLAQDANKRTGVEESLMRKKCPRTYAYFNSPWCKWSPLRSRLWWSSVM